MNILDSQSKYTVTCWFCNGQFEAHETSFCSHVDSFFICPFCLRCGCDAPDEFKTDFLQHCPSEILGEKLILENRTSLKLGEMLIRAGKINRDHLVTAIDKQKNFNARIGQIFIMMGLLTQEELNLYLDEQKGIEHINLENFEIDFDLVGLVGKEFCLENRIVPYEFYHFNKNKVFRFVVSNKQDFLLLKQTNRLRDVTLIPYEASKEEVERLLQEIADYDVYLLEDAPAV